MEFWSTHPSLSSESHSAVTAMYLSMQLSYGTVAFILSYRMKVIKKSLYYTLKSCKSTHIHESARPTLKIFNVHNWQKNNKQKKITNAPMRGIAIYSIAMYISSHPNMLLPPHP